MQQERSTSLQIVQDDPYLVPFQDIYYRLRGKMDAVINSFRAEGGLQQLSKSYQVFGVHEEGSEGQNSYLYKEWAPGAQEISIFGDFNGWNRDQYRAKRVQIH